MTDPGHPGNRPQAPAGPPAAADDAAKPLSPALDKAFKVGLILKGLDGILEVIGGAG